MSRDEFIASVTKYSDPDYLLNRRFAGGGLCNARVSSVDPSRGTIVLREGRERATLDLGDFALAVTSNRIWEV